MSSLVANYKEKVPFPDVDCRKDPHWIIKEFFNYLCQQGALLEALDHITQRHGYCHNEEFCFFPDLGDPDPVYHFEGVIFGANKEEVTITEPQCWEYVGMAGDHLLNVNPSDGATIATVLARIRS